MALREERPTNINTILLGLLLAVVPATTGWTLLKVIGISEAVAVGAVNYSNQQVSILELRAKVASVEVQIQQVKLDIATNGVRTTTTATH